MTGTTQVTFFETSVRVDTPGRSRTVMLGQSVRQALSVGDIVVVRYEPEPGKISNENVLGLALDGQLLWQIEKTPHVYEDSPYTQIGLHDDGSLWASNWDGGSYRLNPLSGAILEMKQGK
jgi:hypothetical protein